MKKTLTLLIAMGSFAVSSEAATVFNYYTPGTDNYNSTIHGFYLSLGSSSLAPSDSSSPSSLSGEIILDSFTLRGAANNFGANVTYGFLVLNGSDNSVIGWSTNTGTTAAGINLTFSFSSLDGSPLLLDAALTYRFLAVSQSVMGLMQDTSKTYLYAAGGTAAPTANTEGDTVTISGGLTAPGIRGHYDAEGAPGDSVVITGANGTNTFSLLSPIFTEIRGEMVPEPATVSLGPAGTGRADDAPPQGLSFLMAKNRRMRAVLAEQLLFFISREEELLIRMRDSCPPEGTGFPGAGGRIRFSPHGGNLLETFLRRNTGKLFLYRKMPVKFGSALFVHMVHGSFHIAAFQAG